MSQLFVDTITEKTSGNGVQIPGHVIQVQQAFLNTTATYNNSNSASDITGLSVSITPKSSASKFYITCHISYSTSANGCGNQIRLKRNGTYIARGFGGSTSDGWFGLDNNFGQANSGGLLVSAAGFHVDTPATASTLTYTVDHFGLGGTTPIKLNLSNNGTLSGVSSLTVMEIAQ
jgi:hypothetical protein